jgi:hypothetical protein
MTTEHDQTPEQAPEQAPDQAPEPPVGPRADLPPLVELHGVTRHVHLPDGGVLKILLGVDLTVSPC